MKPPATNLYLRPSVKERLRRRAVDDRRSMSALVNIALVRYLDECDAASLAQPAMSRIVEINREHGPEAALQALLLATGAQLDDAPRRVSPYDQRGSVDNDA